MKTEGNIDNSYLITSDSEILNNHNISSTDFSDSIISENEVTQENIETQNKPIELSLEDLFGDKYKEITLSKEQITEIYKDLKDYINNNYNGENIIIKTENVKIQISTLDSQQDSELSNVNLGKCAEIIKEKYCKSENDSLLMLKFDITPENEKSTYVQYEVYEQMSKQFLELKECTGTNVIINSPIELNSYIESLYDHLSKYGYNLFNGNDSFYNDICAVYTTENRTDILLYDRRMDIYKSTLNISLCQEGCIFLSYNSETKKAECDCPIQTNEMNLDISSLHFDKNKMLDEFYETLKNSNFRVLKCYQLTYNIKVFIHNLGCIIMSILLLLFNILTIIYLFKNSRKINFFIQSVIKTKYSDSENSKTISSYKELKLFLKKNSDKKEQKMKIKRLTVKSNKTKKKKKKKKLRNSAILINKKGLSLEDNNQLKEKKKNKNSFPPKRKNRESLHKNKKNKVFNNDTLKINSINNLLSSNSIPLNGIENNYINYNANNNIQNNEKEKKNNNNFKRKSNNIYKKGQNKEISRRSTKYREQNLNQIKEIRKEFIQEKVLNDQEMNSLEYQKALELDKRTYFQYYISLIKKKNLILFTFIPTNDYNIISIKISLFLVSFSLYLSINAFFFNDDTMHKIYKDNGLYNILYQIPQIIYSSVISTIINLLLKKLSLSEQDILKIKEEKDMISTVEKSKSIEKCIKIKFVIFFIISFILMSFFWYFISCFCAVYNNTQIILFKDTLVSFALSMVYPFGINLLPGIFRIPSLRAEKKDKKCLYSFSQYLALI